MLTCFTGLHFRLVVADDFQVVNTVRTLKTHVAITIANYCHSEQKLGKSKSLMRFKSFEIIPLMTALTCGMFA